MRMDRNWEGGRAGNGKRWKQNGNGTDKKIKGNGWQ